MLSKKTYNTIEFKEDHIRSGMLVRNIVRELSFKGCTFDAQIDHKLKQYDLYTVNLLHKETGDPVKIDNDIQWYIKRAITEGVEVRLDGQLVSIALSVTKPKAKPKAKVDTE